MSTKLIKHDVAKLAISVLSWLSEAMGSFTIAVSSSLRASEEGYIYSNTVMRCTYICTYTHIVHIEYVKRTNR